MINFEEISYNYCDRNGKKMKLKEAAPVKELTARELRWKCDPASLGFETTKEIEPIDEIIAQDRALKALKIGVEMESPGYNIFIAGLSGTGKASTVKNTLQTLSTQASKLLDYVYVNNFSNPVEPILLTFDAGGAKRFKSEIDLAIKYLTAKVPQVLESESYAEKRARLMEQHNDQENNLVSGFKKQLAENNFHLGKIEAEGASRAEVMPVINGEVVPIYKIDELSEKGQITPEEAAEIVDQYNYYQEGLFKLYKKGMKLEQELKENLENLEREELTGLIRGTLQALKDHFPNEQTIAFLNLLEEDIFENIALFKAGDTETDNEEFKLYRFAKTRSYDVNIILDNSAVTERPVVVETSPNYTNLFGTIERISDGRGGYYADFMNIKAGSLLKANGGVLVLNFNHIESPAVWRNLKKVLTYNQLQIQDTNVSLQFGPLFLKPQPIDITAKVILMGSNYTYSYLSAYEDDFKKIFKVKADFDYEVKRSKEILIQYSRVVKKLINQEGLLDFSKNAVAYLLEDAARYTGNQSRLTSRFSVLSDIAREASYWAKTEGLDLVHSKHVRKAIEEARQRHNLYDEKMNDMIREERTLIEVDGERTGQLNGLVIYSSDMFSYGKPTKISATIAPGNSSIVNVEREVGFSGKIYNKAMAIITGYFREKFGLLAPLAFNANIVFEQSYGGIDGDSASAAQFCVLISALAKIPLKQSIAITGSMNQKGEIQPIGGVNEKIEGFFNIVKMKSKPGNHGVIIPKQNMTDLMLNEEVIAAVKKGTFHIYAVSRIEEALELLTGIVAEDCLPAGGYHKNCIYAATVAELKKMFDLNKALTRDHSHHKAADKKKQQPAKPAVKPPAKKNQKPGRK